MSYPAAVPTETIASAIGEPPTTTRRAAGRWGSMKISSAPPLRHGLRSTTAPSMASTPSASPSSGTRRSSSGSPVSIARSACRRTEDSAHTPPTNPSIVPSGRTTAALPGRTLVGRRARTTVASANGVRSESRLCTWMARSPWIIASILPLHGVPHTSGRAWHVDVHDSERLQRVTDGIDDGRR